MLDAVVSGREAMLNLVGHVDAILYDEARVLLERIGCGHLTESRWGVLSQGERQKILICRALMAKFHVLILDEPCAGLDPVAREHFLQWLHQLATQPGAPSLVLVTHHGGGDTALLHACVAAQGGARVLLGDQGRGADK